MRCYLRGCQGVTFIQEDTFTPLLTAAVHIFGRTFVVQFPSYGHASGIQRARQRQHRYVSWNRRRGNRVRQTVSFNARLGLVKLEIGSTPSTTAVTAISWS